MGSRAPQRRRKLGTLAIHHAVPAQHPDRFHPGFKSTCGKWFTQADADRMRADKLDGEINCVRCLHKIEDRAAQRDKARRRRIAVRARGGMRYYCPYCDSTQIYRMRSLDTRERQGSVSYRMRCRCCGQYTWTNHPTACDQLPPEMLDDDAAVDTQKLIDEANHGE